MGPLAGVKVISSAHQLPGPYCTMLLADLGADVIVVEPPGVGDPARLLPGFLHAVNRNKRSIAVNLKEPAGLDVLKTLVEGADIFLEGFRPGVAARLGMGYDALREVNPRIVYCSISGYGQTGPYRDWPAHDGTYQGIAGLLAREDGPPQNSPTAIADLSSAMFAALSTVSALHHQRATGEGQYIDVSMTDGLVSWLSPMLGPVLKGGPQAAASRSLRGEPGMGIFQCGDGKYITLSIAHEDFFWRNLCEVLGMTEAAGYGRDQRVGNRDALVAQISDGLAKKTQAEWMEILPKHNIPAGPVNTPAEALHDPQIASRGLLTEFEGYRTIAHPVKFSLTEPVVRRKPPELGEHTDEVLKEHGFDAAAVSALRQSGAVA